MTATTEIKGLIFDMDGLMFDTESLCIQVWKEAGLAFGLNISDDSMNAMRGRNAVAVKQIFFDFYPNFPKERYNEIKDLCSQITLRHFNEKGVPIKEGLLELLNFLKSEGYPMALATSTSQASASATLKSAGVFDFFSAKIFGDMVENGKPAPDIFIKAASSLSLPCKNCMVLEDSYNGLKAGRNAGCFTVMIPDLSPYCEEIKPFVDIVADSLLRVPALLKGDNLL